MSREVWDLDDDLCTLAYHKRSHLLPKKHTRHISQTVFCLHRIILECEKSRFLYIAVKIQNKICEINLALALDESSVLCNQDTQMKKNQVQIAILIA